MKSILAPGFRHGIHPEGHKEGTEDLPFARMPFVGTYVLPLSQHTGAPSRPVVEPGDRVERGQLLAAAEGFVSTALHSPVTGRVRAREIRPHPLGKPVEALIVEADPFATQELQPAHPGDPATLSPEEFVSAVQAAGLVGLGGAAFPSHVKYRIPEDRPVDRLLVNGAECEPYLTTDHRLMVERPGDVLRGIRILAAQLGVRETVIGVERNKPDAIQALESVLEGVSGVRVMPLPVKYPQGAEKMLIRAVYGEEVPSGRLPLDLGIVVNNVGTMAALTDWFDRGQPLIERGVTVSGPGVARPSNLLVPVGTPIRELLEACGGLSHETREVVMGGPMMGLSLASLDLPVLKGTSGILAFTEAETRHAQEYTCIRCGRCVEACPNILNPSRLARLSRAGRFEEAREEFHMMDCMECGSCSYACPSGIPIVQLIRVAKSGLRSGKRKPQESS